MVRIMREVTDPNILSQLNAAEPEQESSSFDKATNWIQENINEPIGRPLGALATGVVSGVEKSAASLGNLALMPFTDKRIPYYNPEDMAKSPMESGLMKTGQFLGESAPVVGLGGKISKAMGAKTLAKEMLASGAAGFALGGDEKDDLFSRSVSGVLGAGAAGVSGLTSKAISKKVGARAATLEKKYSKEYKGIFDSLKDTGLNKESLRVPSAIKNIEGSEAAKGFKPQLKRSLSTFTKDPNFKNAHELQSLLNKSKMGADKDVANLARDLQRRVRGEMSQFLTKNKQPEILKKYINATKGYKKEMSPYLNNAVKQYRSGKDTPKQLVKSLIKDAGTTGKSKNYSEIPGFSTRKAISDLPPAVKHVGQGVGLGVGASGAGMLGLPYADTLIDAFRKG